MFFGGINNYALRVTFNDSAPPTWDQTPLFENTLPRALGGDPILVTDKDTGRTFVSQLQALTPTATMDITDDDGASYIRAQALELLQALTIRPSVSVHIMLQCLRALCIECGLLLFAGGIRETASNTGAANCALSVDGGLTFGPAIPVYVFSAVNGCFPLHVT